MRIRTRSERLAEFVRVLRGFGLTDEAIAALNGGAVTDGSPEEVLDRSLPDDLAPSELFDRVRRTLVESRHGFELAPTHEPRSAFVALSLALEPYGCTFAVTDGDGRPITAPASTDGTYRLSLIDSAGNERTTTFAYPDGPLGDANVPALVHAVDADLLVGVSKTFVLLAHAGDGWGFVLLDEAQLRHLRQEFGNRIQVYDRELLAKVQPPAYADGTWQAAVEGASVLSALPESTDDTLPLELEVPSGDHGAGSTVSDERTVRDRMREVDRGDSAESVVERLASRDRPERPDPLFVGEPVDSVFEDFSDVRLEPMDSPGADGTERGDGEALPIEGAIPADDETVRRRRVLVGDEDGGSGPAVVGVAGAGHRDVDDVLETRFERFSEDLPDVVPDAEGTDAFRWHAGADGVASTATGSASPDGTTGGSEDVSDEVSDSRFRFEQDLAESDATQRPPSVRTSARGPIQSHGRSAGNGTEDLQGSAKDRQGATTASWTGRFDRFIAFLSRLVRR